MKTRVIVYTKIKRNNTTVCMFGCFSSSLELDLQTLTLAEFADQNSLLHHDSFDWTVGDGGSQCALFEYRTLESSLIGIPVDLPESLKVASQRFALTWLSFPQAAKMFSQGEDKRYLQLAVQFIAAGEVIQDDVIAAPTDAELMNAIKESLPSDSQNKQH